MRSTPGLWGPMAETLELKSIGILDKIGQGGQGVVYRAPNVKTVFSPTMVFKEYKPDALASLDVDALMAMPEFLESLPFRDGAKLIEIASWPCRIVKDNGRVKGFVMPGIPDDFSTDFWTAKGSSRVAAEIQHLLNPPQVLADRFRENAISERQKYALLRKAASSLGFLHERGVCVGDISPKNLLFSLNGAPAVYFIDCDAMRVKGVSLTHQLETPGWEVPKGEERATVYSDRYKLGLLALRLILGDQDARDPSRLPSSVNSLFRKVVTDTLNRSADMRPTLSEWDLALDKARLAAPSGPTTRPIPTPPKAPPQPPVLTRGPLNPAPPPAYPQPYYPGPPVPPAPPSTSRRSSSKAGWLLLFMILGLAALSLAVLSNLTSSTSENTTASTTSRPPSSRTAVPSVGQTSARATTSPRESTRSNAPDPERFASSFGAKGIDPRGETCDGGWILNDSFGRSGWWATRSVRGSERTSCELADNVLTAYWARYPEPSLARRSIEVAGAVLCSSVPGAACAPGGAMFIMTCIGEAGSGVGFAGGVSGEWITCTGGDGAKVYLF